MKLLKMLINLIVATLVGVAAERVLGAWGMLVGFIAGGVAAWWVVDRYLDF
jgi:hypothetical protein